MKKLHVMHVVDSLETGGMENGIVNLANLINKECFTFSICCLSHPGKLSKRISDDSVSVVALGWSRGFQFDLFMKLAKIFKEQRVDIIHAHGWQTLIYSAVASLISGVPVLINGEHGTFRLEKFRRRFAYKIISYIVDRYVTVSFSLEKELAKILSARRAKCVTIPNGVDLHKFSHLSEKDAERIKSELLIPPTSSIIGSVGRLEPQKNIEELLHVFSNLCRDNENLHCVLIGEGFLKESLEKLASQLGVRKKVHFVGRVDNPHQLISILDLFVSTSFLEGMSNVILEAMACGKPIVATDAGDNDKLIDVGRNGFVVVAKNSIALEKAIRLLPDTPIYYRDNLYDRQIFEKFIKLLLADKAMRKRFGERSRAIVEEKFDVMKMINRYEEIYIETIAIKRGIFHAL